MSLPAIEKTSHHPTGVKTKHIFSKHSPAKTSTRSVSLAYVPDLLQPIMRQADIVLLPDEILPVAYERHIHQ